MNWISSFFLTLILSIQAWALGSPADFGLEVGFRQQSGDSPIGFTAKTQTATQVGAVATFHLGEQFGLRTGAFYTPRSLVLTNDTTREENKTTLNSFDVPLALNYRFEDFASVFAGLALAVNLDSSCTSANCKVSEIKTPLLPFQMGVSFKFAPQMGATLYFENISGSVAKDLSGFRAVGANFLLTFE